MQQTGLSKIVILCLVLILILSATNIFLYQRFQKNITDLENSLTLAEIEISKLKGGFPLLNNSSQNHPAPLSRVQYKTGNDCQYGLRAGVCNESSSQYLRVSAPNGGESVCIGTNLNIQWEQKEMSVVNVSIRQGDKYQLIGTYPPDFNETGTKNKGLIVWKANVSEGYAYEVVVSSSTSGYSFSDLSDKPFSIINCAG